MVRLGPLVSIVWSLPSQGIYITDLIWGTHGSNWRVLSPRSVKNFQAIIAILAACIYWCLAWLNLTLKMEVIFSFETPGFLQTTWSDTPEDCLHFFLQTLSAHFRPWRFCQHILPKHWWTPTTLYGVTAHETVLFIVTAIRTSNPISWKVWWYSLTWCTWRLSKPKAMMSVQQNRAK
jgi:hypothetical protein